MNTPPMTAEIPLNEHKTDAFIVNFYHQIPLYSDLELLLKKANFIDWPSCAEYMLLFKQSLKNAQGLSLTMSSQDENLPYPELSYEERIYQKGIISTRENNWHDFFNVMIWLLFPQTKGLLNALHMKEINRQKLEGFTAKNKRTKTRDAITHLDESGIIVVSDKPELLEGLKSHQWLDVFYHQKELWHSRISAYIIGHGLYEKALSPFIGFTGKMYPLIVDKEFFQLDRLSQYQLLDNLLVKDIEKNNSLKNNQGLFPLPLLGVPGWYDENKTKSFYLNTDYFRPKRK